MFIDQETQRRVNIYAPYKGFSKLTTPEIRASAGVVEIADPVPPDDYSDFAYYCIDQDAPPYAVFTPKALEDKLETKEDGTPLMVQEYNPVTEQMEDTDKQVVTLGLKSQKIAQVKQQAAGLLAATDWMIVREVEGGAVCKAEVKAYRAAVRAASNTAEAAIAAVTTIAELNAAVADWPKADK